MVQGPAIRTNRGLQKKIATYGALAAAVGGLLWYFNRDRIAAWWNIEVQKKPLKKLVAFVVNDSNKLMQACMNDNLETVKFLIKSNEKVSTRIFDFVVAAGNLEIVKHLVENKHVDITEVNYENRTALHIAVINNQTKILEYLIGIVIDIDAKDCYGETALHIAARNGKLNAVKYLVEHGAKIDEKNNDGKTPRIANQLNLCGNYLALAEDFYQVVANKMPAEKVVDGEVLNHGQKIDNFIKKYCETQTSVTNAQNITAICCLALHRGSYKLFKHLLLHPGCKKELIKITKIEMSVTDALSYYVQLLDVSLEFGNTKLFHNIITISHAIDGLPSIINGIILSRKKLEKPSEEKLVKEIKGLKKTWENTCNKKKEFAANITNFLKTKFALEDYKKQEPKKTVFHNFASNHILSYLGTNNFSVKK